jgi:hypothetical protein
MEKHKVDISMGKCICEAGKHEKVCKYQTWILKCFSLLSPNAPRFTVEVRHRIALLALGCHSDILRPLRNSCYQSTQLNIDNVNACNVIFHSVKCNIEIIESEEQVPQNNNTMRKCI